MQRLSMMLCAAMAALLATRPLAQPPQVIVRGAHPLYLPPPGAYDFGQDYYNSPQYIYGDPFDRYYDPAGKIRTAATTGRPPSIWCSPRR